MRREWLVPCQGEVHRVVLVNGRWGFPDHRAKHRVAEELGRPSTCSLIRAALDPGSWAPDGHARLPGWFWYAIPKDLLEELGRHATGAVLKRVRRQSRWQALAERARTDPGARVARLLCRLGKHAWASPYSGGAVAIRMPNGDVGYISVRKAIKVAKELGGARWRNSSWTTRIP